MDGKSIISQPTGAKVSRMSQTYCLAAAMETVPFLSGLKPNQTYSLRWIAYIQLVRGNDAGIIKSIFIFFIFKNY